MAVVHAEDDDSSFTPIHQVWSERRGESAKQIGVCVTHSSASPSVKTSPITNPVLRSTRKCPSREVKANMFLFTLPRTLAGNLINHSDGRKEIHVLFNDTLNTFYLRSYGVRHVVKDHSDGEREETRCRHVGYSFRIAAMVILYASSHRQDNTYHGLCYISRGTLTGTRNRSMGPP